MPDRRRVVRVFTLAIVVNIAACISLLALGEWLGGLILLFAVAMLVFAVRNLRRQL